MNQQYKAALEIILGRKVNISERDLTSIYLTETARSNCLKNLTRLGILKLNRERYGYFDLNASKEEEVRVMVNG